MTRSAEPFWARAVRRHAIGLGRPVANITSTSRKAEEYERYDKGWWSRRPFSMVWLPRNVANRLSHDHAKLNYF